MLSARPTDGGRCTGEDAARCTLGALDPGEEASVRIRFRPLDSGSLRPVVTARGDGVETQRLTLGPIRVKAGKAQLRVRKSAALEVARTGRVIKYRIVVAAGRRGGCASSARLRPAGPACACAPPHAVACCVTAGRGCWAALPGRGRKLTVKAQLTGAPVS